MSLRARIALLAAGAVAAAVLVCAVVAFAATRSELRAGIDESLRARASGPRALLRAPDRASPDDGFPVRPGGPGPDGAAGRGPPPESVDFIAQLITRRGVALRQLDTNTALPVGAEDLAVARGERPEAIRDVRVSGTHLRMLTAPVGDRFGMPQGGGGALQVARPLTEVDDALRGLGVVLLFVALAGAAAAAGLGVLVARSAVRPVESLTEAAEHVARTQDLSAPIESDPARTDEIGRLATSFNAMLRALSDSRSQQQRLVHDASHELRTPLTSLRTNIEVLARTEEMKPADRKRLLADLNLEMEELSNLVGELVDLATAGGTDEDEADVRLDEVAARVVDRARFRSGQTIELVASPSVVRARPTQLQRAVTNVVDNACKWNPPGEEEPITVTVDGGRFEVRDHGPGIDDEDLPLVFDRFYRSPAARSTPGSGLGLAITKQVVDTHGGEVFARRHPDGGAVVGFELPPAAGTPPEEA